MVLWISLALIMTTTGFILLQSDFPVFIYLNLLIALVAIIRVADVRRYSLTLIERIPFLKYTLINLGGILGIYLLVEPWTGLYERLLDLSLEDGVDVTFGWIELYGNWGYIIVLLFSLGVSIFSEELLFRGVLQGYLMDKTTAPKAVILQAIIFTLPQSLILFAFPILDGLVFLLFYSVIAIGGINGYMTYKSKSIFPSVVAASLANFVMTLIYLT
jgi:membrane protease YdiL (CAAX protease family)